MHFRTSHAHMLATMLVVALAPRAALAVDGISVTTHWSGANAYGYGGFGEIWRHDIVDSQVLDHALLYADAGNPGRSPVISPDGNRVAFLMRDGSIGIIGIDGEGLTVLAAVAHGEAFLDWPQGDWLYYTRGGINQPSGSRFLNRVDVATGESENVVVFKKDDGLRDSGTWRFQIAADLRRAAVRADNDAPEPFGRITALDLDLDDGRLAMTRSIDRWSCSAGMDPFGRYFMDGQDPHFGVDIRAWQTLARVDSIAWADTESWGPSTRDSGDSHYRSGWSANSQNWLCIHLGWSYGDYYAARGANQVLIDWVNHERIVVTDNVANSYEFDCAGDFWVIHPADELPHIVAKPNDVVVQEGGDAELVIAAGGAAPLAYQWYRGEQPIADAIETTLSMPASLDNDGAAVHCVVQNAAGVVSSRIATVTVLADTEPPTLVHASATGSPNTVRVSFSEPVGIDSAEDTSSYAIDQDIAIDTARLSTDPDTVVLTTVAPLLTGVAYTLTVRDVTDRAAAANAIAETTVELWYAPNSSGNSAPIVAAGEDMQGRLGTEHLLDGQVTDDGLPSDAVAIVWSQVAGPRDTTASFVHPGRPSTFVTFDTVGDYVLRLTADDGEAVSTDELTFTVTPAAYLEITQPAAGVYWRFNTPHRIEWESDGFDDVRIDYSGDFGETWQAITQSVDVSSPDWQSYPWLTPQRPSDNALIRISGYFDEHATTSGVFVVTGPYRHRSAADGCACSGSHGLPAGPAWLGLLAIALVTRRTLL